MELKSTSATKHTPTVGCRLPATATEAATPLHVCMSTVALHVQGEKKKTTIKSVLAWERTRRWAAFRRWRRRRRRRESTRRSNEARTKLVTASKKRSPCRET